MLTIINHCYIWHKNIDPCHFWQPLVGVLQEKTFTRIGDTALKTSDFRLVAATQRNLQEMIATGLFRKDLYYELLPPVLTRSGERAPVWVEFRASAGV